MSWWVLEAKYRGTELKILEIGDSSPCTAEDDAGSIQAILHMSSFSGKQELRDSTEGTVAVVRFSFLPHSNVRGCYGNCVARYGVVVVQCTT
jgi:hypothetical protein